MLARRSVAITVAPWIRGTPRRWLARRGVIDRFYPALKTVRLVDYKVRVLAASHGTASKVRVLIESGDHKEKWGTVGVSENIIEASWQALADSIEFKLLQDKR